jgi:hypothetical protein
MLKNKSAEQHGIVDFAQQSKISPLSVASCNRQSKIYNLKLILDGVLAQLVERLNGIEEVTGSNPVGSTFPPGKLAAGQTIV